VGADVAGLGNTISGNDQNGVHLVGPGTNRITIVGNRIGITSDAQLALKNLANGVFVDGAPANTIGGTTTSGNGVPLAANVIGCNSLAGIRIEGATAEKNRVLGNFIGTNIDVDVLGT